MVSKLPLRQLQTPKYEIKPDASPYGPQARVAKITQNFKHQISNIKQAPNHN
jgi:hypothetical protein